MIKLIIPGEPISQARPRMWTRGKRTMVYDPQSALKRDLRVLVGDQLNDLEWNHAKYPRVMFWFHMPIPKSMSKSERSLAIKGNYKHIKKPDVDNLIKLYLDVLSGLAFDDDNCVSIGTAIKVYSETPKTVIYIEETTKNVTIEEVWEGTWTTQNEAIETF